ncbi:MAG: hypothetical protein JNL95_05365 [Chitinophagales bacterium]|nr:hypothetical protein [Chitinophagales bacterium]
MKKIVFVTCISSLLFSACKKDITFCGVKDPLNDIGWLKDIVNTNPQNLYIYKMSYNSTEGFYILDNTSTGSALFNSCDNTNIYRTTNGVVFFSNFPQDFNLNFKYKERIYPR